MGYDHTFDVPLARNRALIRVSWSGRPIQRYSVVLLVYDAGRWHEARVFDNHLGTHHMHRYTRSGGKQPSEAFHPGPARAAIPAAIEHLKAHWEAIAEAWKI